MDEGIYVKVSKCDLGAGWVPTECGMRVGEHSMSIAEEVIKQVVL